MSTLQQRIETACEQHGYVSYYNDYSGRGMYGRACVGISGPKSDCMAVIAQLIKDNMDALAHGTLDEKTSMSRYYEEVDTLLGFQMDSMGRDLILYWEGIQSSQEVNAEDN